MYDRRRAQPRILSNAQNVNISVVVPVRDQEQHVLRLHARLSTALDAMRRSWEVLYVDDASQDGTLKMLRGLAAADPRVMAVELAGASGPQAALLAGFERCGGELIVTLGADLADPPEEIGALITTLEHGHDLVAGRRDTSLQPLLRRLPTRLAHRLASSLLGSRLSDWTCSLRACRREVVQRMLRTRSTSGFVPALAASCARKVAEIPVRSEPRRASLFALFGLTRELVTTFTTRPLEMIPMAGAALSAAGGALAAGLAWRAVACDAEPGWPLALAAATALSTGCVLLALGVIAEYVGRLHRQMLGHPRAVISRVHQNGSTEVVEG